MNITKLLIAFILVSFSASALAYGSKSSSKKACIKPTLTNATPAHLATAPAESKFSFFTSSATLLHSIKVQANKIPVDVTIEESKQGYLTGYKISGHLPAEIKKKYVRIDFTATTTNSCQGVGGWLLKIEQ
ncbi:MAG: hypothetical protein A6F70_05870 [Cycloclasticus sp. symbiont of Bathymodiolus heckerae]|nr:MAG: hypothetical protein A6F70_05870 [Cycloclasticus sp. symbiont of Bathymodiolus heckerae]